MKSVHIVVKGRVQGVGFRHFAMMEAKKRHLVGTVKNLYNGNVEIHANGEEEFLKDYLRVIQQGPISAEVSDIDINWQEPRRSYTDFKVIF